jgi:hypothetical protein
MENPINHIAVEDLIEVLSKRIGGLVVECEALRAINEAQLKRIQELEHSFSMIAERLDASHD